MAFGRFAEPARPRPMSEINVTPLVDVMLVLVVIFILAAPLLASSIRLELPRAASAEPPGGAASVLLALDKAGQAYLDGDALPPEALAERLRHIASSEPDAELRLSADAAVPYGRVVQIVGAAQAAGLTHIGFTALPEER
ncbi:ExbD/TolR family protein [Comamonas flocculans]|uniref:Biopolymer transporter ExbD n=1 Tax=Comamonas flocculans TaxID=2597701 RepID=A0A5B8RVK6_9BURK|nr:biopolymer transporter ExbD [Comamonas flocculans]QEA12704.1 biopolymer transporter ExbD [Comamonas flocculans]